MPGLTADEVAFFNAQGYLHHRKPVFKPERFASLKAHFEEKLARWPETSGGLTPEHMDVPHFTDPLLFDWLMDDDVLDLVESLIGPNIALWSSHFICKPPKIGKRVPWHEDSAYWGTCIEPMDVVIVWLAIDPSTQENGCMRVIPGTHDNGYSEYDPVADPSKEVFGREIRAGRFDESTAVDMVLNPNECSIHHAKTIHGSHANCGTMRRCGYTMRYMSTACRYRPDLRPAYSRHQIYLCRGKDLGDNTYGEPRKILEEYVRQPSTATH